MSESVFNEGSIDVDFRVEGNTNANLLFIDGGNDRVGVGTNSVSSDATFGVSGNIELKSAGNRYYVPRQSDGAITGSLYSRTGNTITLSGAGSSSGQIEFIPSSSNSSAVALTLDSSQNATFAGTASFVGMVTSSISGNGFRTIHASTTTKHTSLAYDGLYTAGAQHQYISSGQDIKFYPGDTNEVTFADGGLATFAGSITSGTHLIQGVSNYTGLEVKGSGGSRPQIKWSNVNNGVMGAIYGTESNALIIGTGSSNTTALTIDSSQNATFTGNLNVGVQNGAGNRVITINGQVWDEPEINFYPYSNFRFKLFSYSNGTTNKKFRLYNNGNETIFETGGNNSKDMWFGGDVSAASFTDRTPYPETLKIAYDVLASHKKLDDYDKDDKEHQLDHAKLHDFAKPQITVSTGTPDDEKITKELGQDGRDASAVISCLVEVVNDLSAQVTALKGN